MKAPSIEDSLKSISRPYDFGDKYARSMLLEDGWYSVKYALQYAVKNFFYGVYGGPKLSQHIFNFQVEYDRMFQTTVQIYRFVQFIMPIIFTTDGDENSGIHVNFAEEDKKSKFLQYYNEEYLLGLFEKYYRVVERPISEKLSYDKSFLMSLDVIDDEPKGNTIIRTKLAGSPKTSYESFSKPVIETCVSICAKLGYTYDEFVAGLIISLQDYDGTKKERLATEEILNFYYEVQKKGF